MFFWHDPKEPKTLANLKSLSFVTKLLLIDFIAFSHPTLWAQTRFAGPQLKALGF